MDLERYAKFLVEERLNEDLGVGVVTDAIKHNIDTAVTSKHYLEKGGGQPQEHGEGG